MVSEQMSLSHQIAYNQAHDFAEIKTRNHLLKELSPWVDSGSIKFLIILGEREMFLFLIEITPFCIDDHVSGRGFGSLPFFDVLRFLNIGCIGSSSENDTYFAFGIRVCMSQESSY